MIVCCSFELDNIIQIHHRFSPYLNQVDRDRTTQNPIFLHCIVMLYITDYGRPMKPFFIKIHNFGTCADKLGR